MQGTDTSSHIKFTHGGMLGGEVDKCIDTEIIVCTGTLALIEVVEMVSVVEAEIQIGDVLEIACACLMMYGAKVVDVAVADT